ncbi:MAG: hypothetical protein GY906_10380 [bacterium]|nr:hypothetical protein [bacterium]
MTSPAYLLNALRAAGLDVDTYPDWESRGGGWDNSVPVGTMVHHTAPPVPYPVDNLAGVTDQGRIKCNVNAKADGKLVLIAYGACNYSSGKGSTIVLDEVTAGTTPPDQAYKRGLTDDMNGNPHFVNIEVDHPGDGSPIDTETVIAIGLAHIVLAEFWHYPASAIISHAEWTSRKRDPNWNGGHDTAMTQIRDLVTKGTGVQLGPNGEPYWEDVSDWAKPSWSKAFAVGVVKGDNPDTDHYDATDPKDPLDKEELMVFLDRAGLLDE